VKPPSRDPELDAQFESALAPEEEGDARSVAFFQPNEFTRSRGGVNGFSIVPLWVTREMARARAHHAAFLVNVLLQRMRVRRTAAVAITSAVWAEIGPPSERERRTILKHLRLIPGVLKLENRRHGYTRYQAVKGDMWTTKGGEE
jgi:hypothetical protein